MIYSYNTLGVYTTKDNRQYDNTGNQCILHHYETNKIPNIQLIIDETISSATYTLFDEDGESIQTGSVTVESGTNEAGTSFSRLILKDATTSGQEDGLYSIEFTYDSTTIYFDMFCWDTDLSDYLKVSGVSNDIMIGEYQINMDDFEYLVYLESDGVEYDYEVEEEGVDKTYGEIPLYNSRNKKTEFTITGYSKTHDFLAGLRILWTNGTITFTYKGDEFEVYDIENPDKSETFGDSDIIIIELTVKRKDYLQSRNSS